VDVLHCTKLLNHISVATHLVVIVVVVVVVVIVVVGGGVIIKET
jgi:hypothetical protein